MSSKPSPRWEDVLPQWRGPSYRLQALGYHRSVESGDLAGPLISCVEVVDWDGDGGKDLLVSGWDACYGGGVLLFEQDGRLPDGTPQLGAGRRIEGIAGYVTAVPDGDVFHLLSTSRLRRVLHLYRNIGTRSAPRFGKPVPIELEADWLHDGELLHLARFVDIDDDGEIELVVGTDYWEDYWPGGVEWNEEGYRPYDADGKWLGGPLRGHLYAFRNRGTASEPDLGKGAPLTAAGRPIEMYGQLAPTFCDFRGTGNLDLVCGDFLDRLYFFPAEGDSGLGAGSVLRDELGAAIEMAHCIHFPVAVDWNGDGHVDLLVGAEDGYVSYLRNTGQLVDGAPVFEQPVRVQTQRPAIHAGVLPVPAWWPGQGADEPGLVVGNAAGELLFYPWLDEDGGPSLGKETALPAAGETVHIVAGQPGSIQGPSEIKFGYTCPTVADWDGDGRPDLLVSDVRGRHLFFRNTSAGHPPAFERPRELTFNGQPLVTVWRVRPAVVDWLGDGQLSYLCLDESGLLACYRRVSDTVLGDKTLLSFDGGEVIRFTEDFGGGLGRIKLCVCDWTGDGRYDLLFGSHSRGSVPPGPDGAPRHTTKQAGIFLLENVGSNASPRFADPRPLCHGGAPIRLGMHACSPEPVTSVTGRATELVVGAEDGSLLLLRRESLDW